MQLAVCSSLVFSLPLSMHPPGYANEVGESFRHVVAVRWVYLSYLVSSGYVAAHALQQGHRASTHNVSVRLHV